MQNTMKKAAIGVAGASVIALGGAALSSAQGTGSTSGTGSSATAQTLQGQHAGHGPMRGTPVDATTLAKVKKAVAAKDAGVTIERAFKGADGSIRAMGTKAGKRVHVEINAAMTTVTVRQGGPGDHHRHDGPGGPGKGAHARGAEVTGANLTSVKNAVKAKDSAVTVDTAFTGPDGSFHAVGTKAGKHVMVHVSKDFKTVSVMTGGIWHERGHGAGHGPGDWRGAAPSPQQGGTSSSSGTSHTAPSATGGSAAA